MTLSTEVISEPRRSLSRDALAVLLAASTVVVGLNGRVLLRLRLLRDGWA
jgi:hypothetical protein